jgi:hypothetical protein
MNADNIILRDIQIQGNHSSGYVNGTGKNIRIEHCKFVQPTTGSILNKNIYLTGSNCSIVDSDITCVGPAIITGGAGVKIDRNIITGVASSGSTYNTYINITGSDCIFSNNFVTIASQTYTTSSLQLSGDRIIACNNKLSCSDTSGQAAIMALGIDTKVVNNHIVKFNVGIWLYSDYRQVCNGNTVTESGSNGIVTSSATNTGYGYKTITGNVVYEVGGAGIQIGTGSRIVVADNAIYDATGNGIEGYSGAGNVYYCTITGNHISYCGGDGIFLCGGQASQATGVSVCSNTSHNNVGRGLYLIVASSTVVGNDCFSNGTANSVTDNGGSQVANNVG